MKAEGWLFGGLALFFAIVTPIYWYSSYDPTGTSALVLTFCLTGLVAFYVVVTGRRLQEPRPEDRGDAEIAEGAGELGFFSPYSWWPLYCALSLATVMLGIIFGWWLFLIGVGFGIVSVLGMVFEYYRGEHAH